MVRTRLDMFPVVPIPTTEINLINYFRSCSKQHHTDRWPRHCWYWCCRNLCRILHHYWCFSTGEITTSSDGRSGLGICDRSCGRPTDRRSFNGQSLLALVVSLLSPRPLLSLTSSENSNLPDLSTYSFYINLPFGAVAIAFTFFFMRDPPSVKPAEASLWEKFLQMDIIGALVFCASMMCYLLATSWAGVLKTWNSADVIGTLVGFVVLLVLFCAIEWWQGERALLAPSVMKNRTILSGAFFSFL